MNERARRIVETAVELAEQGGFEAVRLRDVASESGVALGTVYRYFRSKEDLLTAALEREVRQLRERMTRRPPEGATPLERVRSFFGSATRAVCRRPRLAKAVLRAVASGEPELARRVTRFHADVIAMVTQALRGSREPQPPESELEERVCGILQQVWFASLVGWSGGLHGQGAVVDRVSAAAELVLRDGCPAELPRSGDLGKALRAS
jgi:AcrR family transcriptional regulator